MRQPTQHLRSLPIVESLESRQLLSGTITGSFATKIPKELPVAGESHIAVRLTNSNKTTLVEPATVQLYASGSPASADLLLASETQNLRLKGHASTSARLTAPTPTSLPDGNYFLVAEVNGSIVAAKSVNIQAPFSNLAVSFGGLPGKPVEIDGWSAGARKATVVVTNNGNVPLNGQVNLNLYLSPDGTQSSATLLATVSSAKVSLKPGRKKAVQIRIAVPPGTAVGGYFLIANMTGVAALTPAVPANTVAISSRRIAVVNQLPRPIHVHQSVDVTVIDDGTGSYSTGDDDNDSTGDDDPSFSYPANGYDDSQDSDNNNDSGGGDSGYDDSSDNSDSGEDDG